MSSPSPDWPVMWIHNDVVHIHHTRHTSETLVLISLNSWNNVFKYISKSISHLPSLKPCGSSVMTYVDHLHVCVCRCFCQCTPAYACTLSITCVCMEPCRRICEFILLLVSNCQNKMHSQARMEQLHAQRWSELCSVIKNKLPRWTWQFGSRRKKKGEKTHLSIFHWYRGKWSQNAKC